MILRSKHVGAILVFSCEKDLQVCASVGILSNNSTIARCSNKNVQDSWTGTNQWEKLCISLVILTMPSNIYTFYLYIQKMCIISNAPSCRCKMTVRVTNHCRTMGPRCSTTLMSPIRRLEFRSGSYISRLLSWLPKFWRNLLPSPTLNSSSWQSTRVTEQNTASYTSGSQHVGRGT